MKTVFSFIFALVFTGITFGQNAAYEEALSKAIEITKSAQSVTDWQEAANQFDRIVAVVPSEWLPQYYIAFTNNRLVWLSLEKEDYDAYKKHITAADEATEKVKSMSADQAEIYILEANTYQAKIMRRPMVNGPRYSSTLEKLLQKAASLEPNNPRGHYILALQWLNMPAFFGGGKEKALVEFEKAAKGFEEYELASKWHPNWGKQSNANMLSRLKG